MCSAVLLLMAATRPPRALHGGRQSQRAGSGAPFTGAPRAPHLPPAGDADRRAVERAARPGGVRAGGGRGIRAQRQGWARACVGAPAREGAGGEGHAAVGAVGGCCSWRWIGEGRPNQAASVWAVPCPQARPPGEHIPYAGSRFAVGLASLSGHLLAGEERFAVEQHADGSVWWGRRKARGLEDGLFCLF
jgi:hypothetical protein